MEEPLSRRNLKGALGRLVTCVAVAMSLFHLYFSTVGVLDAVAMRSIHLVLAMIIVFALYPPHKKAGTDRVAAIDVVLMALAVAAGAYIVVEFPRMTWRLGSPNFWDVFFGAVAVLLTLEITRRTVGWPLVIIATVSIAYAFIGPHAPGFLAHRGFPVDRVVSQLYCSLEGIYGFNLGVMVNSIFLFILFGALLQETGGGSFFIKLAYSLAGRSRSGPAQTAVISSALVGSISGTGAANVLTTGVFTIPLMKRVGYHPHIAAAIEAAASSGGVIMPPVMGAAAFIMAEWTGVPYVRIVEIAAIPAIMYYLSVGAFVHFEAGRLKLRPAGDEAPALWATLKEGVQFLLPLAMIIGVLLKGFTPAMAATAGILSLCVVSMLRKETRLSLKRLLGALEKGAKDAVLVSACCACAGIVIGVTGLTGLGLKLSSVIISLAGHDLFAAVLVVGAAAFLLGMGLPSTVAYVILIIVAGSALKSLGVPLIVAHMIAFWFTASANVTPPVCVAAYAAAGLAGASPMRTGLAATRIAAGLLVLPFLFAYTPILTGTWAERLLVGLTGSLGMVAFAAFLTGFFFKSTTPVERGLLALACIGLLWPSRLVNLYGFGVLAAVAVAQLISLMSAKRGCAHM